MKKGYYKLLSAIFLLFGVLLGTFVYPGFFNRGIDFLNNKTGLEFSHFTERPFRLGLDLQGGTQMLYQADLSDVPESERSQRMDSLQSLIGHRIDQFGIVDPLVQIKGDRLVVELAGVVDSAEAMRMIGETPFLEFKELYVEEEQMIEAELHNAEALVRAEEILGRVLAGEDFSELARSYSDDPGSGNQGGDLGWFGRGIMVPEFEEAVFGLSKDEISSEIIETQFGYHVIQKTEDENDDGQIKASHILIEKRSIQDGLTWRRTELGGHHLKTARYIVDPLTGRIQIELEFTTEGAQIFAAITERNVGQPLAIFLDGRSIIDTTGDGKITEDDLYAPMIQETITGGRAVITGDTSLEKAREIVNRLRSGALPVPIQLMSHQSVGPALGMDSLTKSLGAGLWGFLAIAIFMIIFYRLPGILAVLSLSLYILLVLSIFKALPVTLTLSGIAGFILSIGMAIDANILIFSRMREELALGKNIRDSIDSGFNMAWSSIRDGNVTTLIVAFILFFIGTSFVKGFALTLIIGISVSMFSSMIITKYFLKSFEGGRLADKRSLWK